MNRMFYRFMAVPRMMRLTEAAPFRVTMPEYGRGDPRMAMSNLAHRFSRRILAHFLSAILGFSAGGAFAQTYPVKPVRMIVPFTAGGTSDAIARAFAQKFSEAWKYQVLVENRPGAGTIIGSEVVAKAVPDGHTLLIAAPGHAVLSSIYRKLPFDPVNDFAPVSQIITTYHVLVVHPSVPAGSLKELIALARSQSGKLNYGHAGVGTATHLVGEMLRISAGIPVVAVPYKGDAGVGLALLTGEVQFGFMVPTNALDNARAGRLRALAVTGGERGSAFPNVPTVAEAGLPDFEYTGWVGILAPAGTPRDILTKISGEVARVLRMPDIAARLPAWGGDAAGTTPEQFSAKFRSDVVKFAKIVKEAGIPPME